MRRDYRRVLDVLGEGFDDVPIACAFDNLAAVYRADAHEKLGHVDQAVRELTVALRSGSPRVMLESVRNQPTLQLVPQASRQMLVPRLRWWKVRHRSWLAIWIGGTALLASQWAGTYWPAMSIEPLHLFEVHSVLAPVAALLLGVIPHWRWEP